MGDLFDDTAVHGEAGEAGTAGTYSGHVTSDWSVFGPNGGYLAAIALRAAGMASGLERPARFNCHFLGPVLVGPVRLAVRRAFGGKRAESLHVSMTQQERPVLEASVWAVGERAAVDLDDRDVRSMPESPPIETLPEWDLGAMPIPPSPRITLWTHLEQRLIGWQGWHEPGEPQLDGWYRFRPRPVLPNAFADAARALIAIYVGTWLAAMNPHIRRAPIIAPAMALGARFYHPASTEWLRCLARSDIALGGLIDGAATVWTRDGDQVAQGDCQMLYRTSGPLAPGANP
ncbi:acyl-CoA thioesterase [Pendulispora albinea]|uniref:Thioesterase family protein n=1 Tax=Pendulispora albinea TaxID=2741071 RepID=A0ABZ2MAH7_9BACT